MSLAPTTALRSSIAPARSARRIGARAGMTLVELVVVLGLLGVLASIALPNMMRYTYRARRAEAYYGLKMIHDLEISFFTAQNVFSDSLDEIGFQVGNSSASEAGLVAGDFYTYSLATWDFAGKPSANFRATATGNIDPGDDIYDIIIIENQLIVKN